MKAVAKEERRVAYPLVLVFCLLAAGIVTSGCFYYRNYERQFRADAERQLSAVAELKVNELVQYRNERLWDAGILFNNPAFSGLVRRFLEHPEDAEAQPQIERWAAKYLVTEQYDLICLFDAQGVIRMAVPVEPLISSFVSQNVPEILRSGRVVFQDFTKGKQDQRAYLALLVPIFDESDTNRPLGVLALRVDPETYLYPFIQRWPTPSLTAETLLVRRDGNDALFLNELKFQTNTALNLRISLANTNAPTVKAILGEKGFVEGTDYRGVPTLAALQAVPDSPWFLVAKMDTAEVYAPLHERLRLTILFVGLLLVSAGVGIGAIWRHQRVRFYKERYEMTETVRRSETKFRTLYDSTSDAVMLLDTKGFWDCNPATLAMFGCASREEFCSKHPADVSPPVQPDGTDSRTLANQRIAAALEKGTNHFEWIHKRADTGETFTADVLLSAMELDGKPVLQAVVRDITARKRAEEALTVSETRYRRLFEAARDGILILDAVTGKVVDANPFLTEIMGYSHKEFLGKTVWELGFFKDIVANQAKFEESQKKEYIRYEDLPLKTSDGRRIHVEFVSNVYQVNQQKVIQCNIRDMTARREAEESLYYEQTLMATLMDNLPDAIYFKDAASRFLRVNRAHSRKFGLSNPAQLVGKSDTDFFTREHSRQALADEQEIIRTGQPLLNAEEKETWMDGTVSWVVTTKLPLRDAAGRIIGTCGISLDITERKRAEEALQESQALYYSLAEQLPIGVFRKDREGRFVLVNPEFCRLKAMKAEDFLGKTLREVAAVEAAKSGEMGLVTKYAAAGVEHHEQIMQTGKPIELVEEYESADGRKQFLRVLKSPVFGPDGKIIGSQGIQFDITERKQAEETITHERQLLRTLIDLLPETFYIKDLDSRFLVANEALAKQWGKASPSELIGLSDADLFPAGQVAQYRAAELKVFAGEPLIGREGTCVFADGREHTVLTTKVPYRDSQGRICGLVGFGYDITERKRAEAALQEAGDRFQLVTRATKDAVWDWNLTDPAWWNDTFYEVYGFDRNSSPPSFEAWASHIHPDDQKRVMMRFRAVVEHGEAMWSDEFRFRRADGAYGYVMDRAYGLRNASGKIVRMIGSMIDITERKRAEEALRESDVRYRTLFGESADGILIADIETKTFKYANPALCRMLGYTEEELQTMGLPDIHPKEAVQSVVAEFGAQVRGDTTLAADIPCLRKDGSVVQVDISAVKMTVDGRPCIVGFFRDITERKRAENALRESEAELRSILESTGDGILAVDRSGEKVIKVNRRYAEMWRIPQSIIDAGDNNALRNFVLNQLADPDAFLKRVHELYNTDTVAMDTLVFKDGRIFERHGFPMMITGAVLGRVWSFRDITERKRQERELIEKSVELERFTYTVSHDLKSPLVTVKTFLGYLEQDLLNPDAERVKQDVGYMRGAADKMGHLLDELLNLARVGRKMNPPVRVTFQQVAREAIGLVAGRISTSRAEVSVADAAVVLEGDRPRLVEIWQNLVENACKFMGDQPKPRVEIGVEQRGAETVFFVRDNGAGIEPRYHEKVFSLFEKLNPKIEGTGMGLALVKRVVELYKGRIWVESGGPGQGANFLFTLPAAVIIEAGQSS